MVKNQLSHPSDAMPQTQLDLIRQQAEKLLRQGYNLFADITLRLIESHEAQARELDWLRRSQAERQLETEFLARENQELRAHIADMEIERRRLTELAKRQQNEIAQLR
ncbi:MAG: hypothetical protein K8I30_18605, partial [Anaerolineae bacterium]|nr:hypothetical protein [Anaerolineae bacterium]